jgi:hypothetical protein
MSQNGRMMKSRALIPFVLILAVAAASAGCGGSGGTTPKSSMTKQQFAAKITEICTDGNKKIAKTNFLLGSAGSVANSGQAVADIESGMIDKFKSLQPPDEIKSQADDFISKAETSRDKLTELVHVAKNFDAENVAKLTPGVASAKQDVHDSAKSFGATC